MIVLVVFLQFSSDTLIIMIQSNGKFVIAPSFYCSSDLGL
jgi:hypothetical protein